jgi:hypothetical protein
LDFIQLVYDNCILPKLQPADGLLKHTWLNGGGPEMRYVGQQIWDLPFLLDLLCILPG